MDDKVTYLNHKGYDLLSGSLAKAIESLPAKVQKAPLDQWMSTLKSLVGKGLVKQAEIDDCELQQWMESRKIKGTITRQELIDAVNQRKVTIKEVTLGKPQYKGFSHAARGSGETKYNEILFIANSERANLEDRIEEVEWELEQFNFDIARLSENPEALFLLEEERSVLLRDTKKAYDFHWPHFQANDLGRHGKNLIAHGRETIDGNIFLVEEIQSDWGQRGRMLDWKSIPKGPFVVDTKAWAGLVMRRMMQRAALNPAVEKFYWIRGSMRNGGQSVPGPNSLDDFYLKNIGGIVDRVISPAGQKCRLDTLVMANGTYADVPCFDMTPAVRDLLKKSLPLYSASSLLRSPQKMSQEDLKGLMKHAESMIGSSRHIRLVNHLYDISNGKEVAGIYMNSIVQASLSAKNPKSVLNHECFHFAMDKLFTMNEKRVIHRDFAPGTELNNRVKMALIRANERGAADQCKNPEEAAAHGFSLWSEGLLDVEEVEAGGLFKELRLLVSDTVAWFRKNILEEKVSTVKEVFSLFAAGGHATYSNDHCRSEIRPMDVHREKAVVEK